MFIFRKLYIFYIIPVILVIMDYQYEQELEELRDEVETNTKLLEHNNKMLRKIQGSMRARTFLSFIYWVIVIGSMFGLYYYLQPVVEGMSSAYDNLIAIPEILQSYLPDL